MSDPRGPAWLGIGAQRCGTTWFTDLLVQHPAVSLSRAGAKELHALYRGLLGDALDLDAYRAEFDVPGRLAGEFTPYYLRALWVPPVARAVLRPGAPVLVLLRDPVDRFRSAVRLYQRQRREGLLPDDAAATRLVAADATWGGMYATHLDAWARELGRDRLVVLQYEKVRDDPQAAADAVWRRLGLDPVALRGVEERSWTSTPEGWEIPAALRAALVAAYAPEAARLRAWGVDPAAWPNLAAAAG